MSHEDNSHTYKENSYGDITVDDVNLLCHTSRNFLNNNRNTPDFYKMISPDFFTIGNKERYDLLDKNAIIVDFAFKKPAKKN